MSYLNWHVGMKVVCIEAPSGIGYGDEHLPEVGSVYTIRELFLHECDAIPCLRLVEVVNQVRTYEHVASGELHTLEPAFNCRRFRPVQTRKTDISVFTQMLNPSKIKVGEPA